MPDPLAYFLTWTTYGTWLPGDERGWNQHGQGFRLANPHYERDAETRMKEDACILNERQRTVVNETIADHCRFRGWTLFAVNCRSNHVHVVVAANATPDEVMRQLKAWCTRRLKESAVKADGPNDNLDSCRTSVMQREYWWTERGSKRYINDEVSLQDAVQYVLECQDHPH